MSCYFFICHGPGHVHGHGHVLAFSLGLSLCFCQSLGVFGLFGFVSINLDLSRFVLIYLDFLILFFSRSQRLLAVAGCWLRLLAVEGKVKHASAGSGSSLLLGRLNSLGLRCQL